MYFTLEHLHEYDRCPISFKEWGRLRYPVVIGDEPSVYELGPLLQHRALHTNDNHAALLSPMTRSPMAIDTIQPVRYEGSGLPRYYATCDLLRRMALAENTTWTHREQTTEQPPPPALGPDPRPQAPILRRASPFGALAVRLEEARHMRFAVEVVGTNDPIQSTRGMLEYHHLVLRYSSRAHQPPPPATAADHAQEGGEGAQQQQRTTAQLVREFLSQSYDEELDRLGVPQQTATDNINHNNHNHRNTLIDNIRNGIAFPIPRSQYATLFYMNDGLHSDDTDEEDGVAAAGSAGRITTRHAPLLQDMVRFPAIFDPYNADPASSHAGLTYLLHSAEAHAIHTSASAEDRATRMRLIYTASAVLIVVQRLEPPPPRLTLLTDEDEETERAGIEANLLLARYEVQIAGRALPQSLSVSQNRLALVALAARQPAPLHPAAYLREMDATPMHPLFTTLLDLAPIRNIHAYRFSRHTPPSAHTDAARATLADAMRRLTAAAQAQGVAIHQNYSDAAAADHNNRSQQQLTLFARFYRHHARRILSAMGTLPPSTRGPDGLGRRRRRLSL